MNQSAFEQLIVGGGAIPLKDAADFYLAMKKTAAALDKTAGLADAPDETGELEGRFEVPVENMAALLQNAITKATTVLGAATVYGGALRGPLSHGVSSCVNSSRWHAEEVIRQLSRRASVLAGPVHVGDIPAPPASTNPVEIAKYLIRGWQEVIQALNEIKLAAGSNPTATEVALKAAHTQNLIDDLWLTLDPQAPPAVEPAAPVQMAQHEAAESPEGDEANESQAFQDAEQVAGTEQHEVPTKQASSRIHYAMKLAFDAMSGDAGGAMAAPGVAQQTEPVNYLAAEVMGRQAQEANEANFYRSKSQEADMAAQQAQAELAELQAQLQQAQAQNQATASIVSQAQAQAMAAQDETLRQTQAAANIRMGMQQLRANLMQLASQDPAPNATAALGAPAPDAAPDASVGNGPDPEQAPADAAAAPASPPQAAPPGGGYPTGQDSNPAPVASPGGPSQLEPAQSQKIGSVESALSAMKSNLPLALAGAGAGAGAGVLYAKHLGKGTGAADAKVKELEGKDGFLNAMRLVAAKNTAHQAHIAKDHPGQAALQQALRFGGAGAAAAPVLASNLREILTP